MCVCVWSVKTGKNSRVWCSTLAWTMPSMMTSLVLVNTLFTIASVASSSLTAHHGQSMHRMCVYTSKPLFKRNKLNRNESPIARANRTFSMRFDELFARSFAPDKNQQIHLRIFLYIYSLRLWRWLFIHTEWVRCIVRSIGIRHPIAILRWVCTRS